MSESSQPSFALGGDLSGADPLPPLIAAATTPETMVP